MSPPAAPARNMPYSSGTPPSRGFAVPMICARSRFSSAASLRATTRAPTSGGAAVAGAPAPAASAALPIVHKIFRRVAPPEAPLVTPYPSNRLPKVFITAPRPAKINIRHMSQPTQAAPADASRYLPLLLVLFASSGCSALIYETVWYQLLQLAIGSTAVSLGFLLATFMGGLCIGSVWFPRLRLAGQHPLRIYAYLELGIAASALLVHLLLPLVNMAYIAGAEHGMPGFLLRGFLSAICLLPPTILMGALASDLLDWLKSTPNGVSWYGLLYGGNTAGAVFGCLLAGFYLLRIYNMSIATYAAAAINVAVALASLALAARTPAEASVPETAANSAEADAEAAAALASHAADGIPRWTIYVAIGLSGATALGAEVVWTRLLGMLLGLTVYVFSITLPGFQIGRASR